MSFTRITFGPAAPQAPAAPATSIFDSGLQVNPNGTTAPASPEDSLAHAANQVSVRAGKATYSYRSDREGPTVESRTQSVQMAHVPNGADGILATANRGGTPKAVHDLKPTDEVTYMGQTMRLEVAERIGLITRDPQTGLYAKRRCR